VVNHLRIVFGSIVLLPTAALGQGVFFVDNLADSGAGSLRAAIAAANAASQPSTIEVRTAGTIVLGSGMLPPCNRTVRITQSGASGRLRIDARALTSSAPGRGLALHGAGSELAVPLTVLLNRGMGVVVAAGQVIVRDLEVFGGDNQGVFVDRADDLVIERLRVGNASVGLLLQACARARIATGSNDDVTIADCTSYGILVSGGSNNVIGRFVSERNDVGVLATNTVDVTLGAAGSMSAARSNTVHGVHLIAVRNNGGPVLRNTELAGNGNHGLLVSGGSAFSVHDVVADGNVAGGISLSGGAAQITVGPDVVVRNSAGMAPGPAAGLGIRDVRDIVVADAQFGPGNAMGISVSTGASPYPTNITLQRVQVTGNFRGVEVIAANTFTLADSGIEFNFGVGLDVRGSTGVNLARTAVRANADFGLLAQDVTNLSVGPSNRIEDNLYHGAFIARCPALQCFDNPSIARNRGAGMAVRESRGAMIRNTTFAGNSGVALWVLEGAEDTVVGPGVVVRDTFGTGIRVETVGNVLVQGCTVTGNSSTGVHFLADARPSLQGNRVQSCLIADNPNIGLRLTHTPRVLVEASTIARNTIGVHASLAFNGTPARCEFDSCIVWDNSLADYATAAAGEVVPRNSFFRVPAPNGGGNRNDDPQLVAASSGDYRLRSSSPARDAGSGAIVFAGNATDAFGQPRIAGARVDCGAYEVHGSPQQFVLSSNRMPVGGGALGFHLLYPSSDAGALSLVLSQIGPPSGSFPFLGATIPLALTPYVLLIATDPVSVNTIATVPPSGAVTGRLDWTGRLPVSLQGLTMSLCGLTVAGVARTVTNIVTFDVR
jgi:hypothetical protein